MIIVGNPKLLFLCAMQLYGYIEPQETFQVFSGSALNIENMWNKDQQDGRHKIAYEFDSSLC